MMGTKARIFNPIAALTLDELIPAEHFYRQLDHALDLSFVRDLVRDYYAPSGRPSVDPVVFFKLQLVLFFEGIRSERQLLVVAADRLSIRWYLGYDLAEPLPDHSSLTRIRDRYGIEVFRRFFEHILEQCQQAGLVWGRELYIDATKVEANADIDSLMPRFVVEAHLDQLFSTNPDPERQQGRDVADRDEDAPSELVPQLPPEREQVLHEAAAIQHAWIEHSGRPNRAVRPSSYRRTADFRISSTDPDATPMPCADGHTRLGYQDHYVVDGGRARIILAALVAPAEVQENQPALDLLWRTRFRWKLRPEHVTGDAKYGTNENIAALEGQGIRAYVALSAVGHRPGRFRDEDFAYDPATDTYTCPGGATLTFLSACTRTNRRIYQAPTTSCRVCALRESCTTSSRGRRIGRRPGEGYRERVRSYLETEPYAKALRKRAVWVEPLFAEAKQWHGLRRFRLRGLVKVNSEALLVASGQNLKRLLSRRGWGGRAFPGGAAGIRMDPSPQLSPQRP